MKNREICVNDFLLSILEQWKKIIIVAFVFASLVFAVGATKMSNNQQSGDYQSKELQSEIRTIAEYEAKLSEQEVSRAQLVVAYTYALNESIEYAIDFLQKKAEGEALDETIEKKMILVEGISTLESKRFEYKRSLSDDGKAYCDM